MHALSRSLTRLFHPAPARRPDPHRKAREEAKPLAAKHSIEVEREETSLIVWPPKGYKGTDPWDGDHGCDDWSEVLVMVRHYAGVELFTEPA